MFLLHKEKNEILGRLTSLDILKDVHRNRLDDLTQKYHYLEDLIEAVAKDNKKNMSTDEYQELSRRTAPTGTFEENLQNFIMGLIGEMGEVIDYIKKVEHHGHEFNKDKLTKEIGDLQWYVARICDLYGIMLSEAHKQNIEKLKKRYPGGFSKEASIGRKENETDKVFWDQQEKRFNEGTKSETLMIMCHHCNELVDYDGSKKSSLESVSGLFCSDECVIKEENRRLNLS